MTTDTTATDGVTNSPDTVSHSDLYFEVGDPVRDIDINVDHAIVKHFSEHLYSSPNKAIEELVSNGFDALATRCYVYVPGSHVQSRVVVWDNGISMGVDQIEAMWQIAKSPKEALGGDRIVSAGGRKRAVIGKFGIGKLASYAVGERISHICRTPNGDHFAVSVDYRSFTPSDEQIVEKAAATLFELDGDLAAPPAGDIAVITEPPAAEPSADGTPPQASVRKLTAAEAEIAVRAVLSAGEAVDVMLNEPHWTLAVIDDLRANKPLYPARLAWVLGNGMPLRPDFQVWVEDEKVKPKLADNASTIWTLSEDAILDALKNTWTEARDLGRVEGDIDFTPAPLDPDGYQAKEPNADEPALVFPHIGRVTATVRLFEDSLPGQKDEGRSHGFFLMVRGRLVNPDDDKLFLHDPSFGTFYRSQFIIQANGIDAELLADRESLRRDTPMTRELQALQTALYRAARVAVNKNDTVKASTAKPESRLPVRSRELFRDPMAALFSRSDIKPTSIDLDEPKIDRKTLGETEPLSRLEGTTGHLQVNSAHPFYRVVEDQAGGGKKGAAVMRAFDLFAIAERLTEGFLYGRGIPEDQVLDILEWRDKLFRSLALGYGRNADDAILELRASSVAGDARFENAIAEVFKLMGFTAVRDGASGEKDIVAVAPIGPGHRVFIIEAKGSGKAVENVTAAVASAASHRDKVDGATHAIIVAREFAGFEKKDAPAVLEECCAVKDVSLVTVETIVCLYEALMKYAYPLETIMDALFVLESPDEKVARVAELERPLHEFNFGDVLTAIWEGQSGASISDLVPLRALWQSRPEWRQAMSLAEFTNKLTALSHFAGRLMVLDTTEHTVHIIQHPEFVTAHVERALHPPITGILTRSGSDLPVQLA
jgi:hypothetical protein